MVKSDQKKFILFPQSSALSSRSTKAPTNLCGIECENGVFVAWLEKSGPVKEAAFILPFTTAFDKTVNDEQPTDLYPANIDGMTEESILTLWKIDYIMNRREPTREHSNSILFSKGYPFRCFVWIRPDEGLDSNTTLESWLYNLSDQMMTFVSFTSKHETLYGKFKWGINIRVIIDKTIHYAAQELLDGDVLRILRDSYQNQDTRDLI